MQKHKIQFIRFIYICLFTLVLSACGGGEGDTSGGGGLTNQVPIAIAGPNQSVTSGATVRLDGSGSSDSDGSIASYTWTQTAGITVSLTGAGTSNASFTAPSVNAQETLIFQLAVTDNGGATATSNVSVTVNPATGFAGDGQLDLVVDTIRQRHGLPSLAAIIIRNDQTIEKSAMGNRSVDANIPITVNDQWHIGSITKSMTSLLAALLVRDGFIQWTSTLADIYPELVGIMLPEYQDVRLEELLSHISGLPRDPLFPVTYYWDGDTRPFPEQRQEIVSKSLVLPPTNTRGEFAYSNLGYIVAGSMLERVTGSDWESLIQDYVFNPLVMTQAGFGAPDTQGTLAQPVGHSLLSSGVWSPWDPWDPGVKALYDSADVFGPAGTVYASLDDMATYLGLHLRGLRGETVTGFLTGQEFAKLYTPFPNSNYALGWSVENLFIAHNGSNGLWLALANVSANRNAAFFIVTNAVDDAFDPNGHSWSAINELRDELYTRFDAAFP